MIEGDIADIKNTRRARRYAGAISAAKFLEEFVGPRRGCAPWDIAGPAWAERAKTATREGGRNQDASSARWWS